MPGSPRYPENGAANRCSVCGGKFGLIRHDSWRAALCSGRCVDRFKSREQADRIWLFGLQVVAQAAAAGIIAARSGEAAQ